ncbi:hypothetical protein FOA52_008333 [Chlamydomonas sp. UWO 241]|nr:hypothetical protein FOA52_008333 [Chlamydomonas sp. UWO 241]
MALSLRSSLACAGRVRASAPVRVPHAPLRPAPVRPSRARAERPSLIARADDGFDGVLATWADKFEKVENKPIVVAYIVGVVSALIVTEWLIHLPGLNVLLGFPLQLVGVLMTPVLVTRYVLDKKDVTGDVVSTVDDISKRLPGINK